MPKVTNNIRQATERLKSTANILLWQAARSHVSISRQLAAVDTRYMRDHVRVIEIPRAGGVNDYLVVSEAEYSLFVEFGTVNMIAQPFFMPGFDSAVMQLRATAQATIQPLLGGNGAISVERLAA